MKMFKINAIAPMKKAILGVVVNEMTPIRISKSSPAILKTNKAISKLDNSSVGLKAEPVNPKIMKVNI